MKKATLFLLFLYATLHAPAQGIGIGQILPMDAFRVLLKSTAEARHSVAVQNKPLLLCFWNTHCAVGTEFLPSLDSLQESFAGKVQVVLVYSQPAAVVEAAFRNMQALKGIRLPLIINDTFGKRYFPHRIEPHIVWLNPHRRVEAITSHNELTAGNLQTFLSGRPLVLPLKKEEMDPVIYYSRLPLLVSQYEEYKDNVYLTSYFGGPRAGISSGTTNFVYNPANGLMRTKGTNINGWTLYRIAFKKTLGFHPSRVILEKEAALPVLEQTLCYDLLLRDTSKAKAAAFMLQDLDRYFGLQSRLEKRLIKVWVLKRTSANDKLKSKVQDSNLREAFQSEDGFVYRNVWLRAIIESQNDNALPPLPLVDETGYEGPVDLVLPTDWQNVGQIRNNMKKYDLELVEEIREMEVIVLQ